MPYKYCQHVKENGTFCGSGAVKGRSYCYFHLRSRARRLALAQAHSQQKPWRPELPPLEDMHSVQVALMQVMEALATDALDPRRAGLILYGLQQAAANIKANAWLLPSRFAQSMDEDGAVDSYPGLEYEFGLPRRIDLDAPPDVLFPPPAEPKPSPKPIAQRAAGLAAGKKREEKQPNGAADSDAASTRDHSVAKKPPGSVKPQKRTLEHVLPSSRVAAMSIDQE